MDAKKIQARFKLNKVYYDLNNRLSSRLGGFAPSIIVLDNKFNILLYSPVFKDSKMNEELLYRIEKITNFSILSD